MSGNALERGPTEIVHTVECVELLDAKEPIRQGDVLEWLNGEGDPWRQHAIVVTADCDIVHEKHAGALATVAVLPYDRYLATFVLPPKLRAAEAGLRERARGVIRGFQAKYRPDRPTPLSDQAIDGWIDHSDVGPILETLRVEDDPQRSHLSDLVEWIRGLSAVEEGGDLSRQIDALLQAKLLGGSKQDPSALRSGLVRDNLDRVKSLPGDALFLHSLGGSLNAGYVVYLRRVSNVDDHQVALLAHEFGDPDKVARRISRLASPYVYRLTQQLGQVFSAIGLPRPYEISRNEFLSGRGDGLKGA